MPDRFAVRGLIFSLAVSLIALLGGTAQPVAGAEPAGYEYFHTYAEMEAAIDKVVADHPNLASKFSIGQSYEGREIWGVKLTANVDASTKGKPEVLINGLMHARERASSELAIYMFQVLANNYGLSGRFGTRSPASSTDRRVGHPDDESRRRRVRLLGRPLPRLAQEPPAHHQPQIRRHRSQPPVRVHLELLWWLERQSASTNYRGWAPEVAPEVQAYEDFIKSRRMNGTQRITEILSLHSAANKFCGRIRTPRPACPRR